MNGNRLGIYISTILIAVITLFACQKENHAPIIQLMYAFPDSVFPGDTVEIGGTAKDYDTDELSLQLFYMEEILEEPIWIAPKILGDHYIVFSANDGINTVEDSIRLYVKDTTGLLVDHRDNHEYKWVKIGTQMWMAENLAYLPLVSSSIDGSDSLPYYYVYRYEGSSVPEAKAMDNYETYGVLYNWEAAKISCPIGWHLPSDEEWKMLELHLGMTQQDADEIGWRASGDVGMKLKSPFGWFSDGNGDNSSGFNALPGGVRNPYISFYNIEEDAFFWSSTVYRSPDALYRFLFFSYNSIRRFPSKYSAGMSVRCIKDE